MNRADIELALAVAIDAESQMGVRWCSGEKVASVVFRRWGSFSRRHPNAKHLTVEDQVLDLAKGLQAHFEPDIPYTHKSDWLHLAGILARVLVGEVPDEPGAT